MAAPHSKEWLEMYRTVAAEMKMPARGKRGSPENKERQRLAPFVFQETRRRLELKDQQVPRA